MQRLPLRAATAFAVAALLVSPAICQAQRAQKARTASITINSSLSSWNPIAYEVDGKLQPRQSVGETRTFRRGSQVTYHTGGANDQTDTKRLVAGRYRFTAGEGDTLKLVRNSGGTARIIINSSLSSWQPIAYFVDEKLQPRQKFGETRTYRSGSQVRWHTGTPENQFNTLRLATGTYRFATQDGTLTLTRNTAAPAGDGDVPTGAKRRAGVVRMR